MQLMAHHEASEDAVVVRFEGEVDLSVGDAFWSHLTAAIDAASANPVRPLIIDLQAVGFFGSPGLRDLVRCHDEGASNGIAVGLVCAGSIVAHVAHATAVDEILPLYPTVDDALRSLCRRVKPGESRRGPTALKSQRRAAPRLRGPI
jgi:anti-sigma B factor antagonist